MKFEFNGDWHIDLKLEKLADLHSSEWFTSEKNIVHKTKLENGFIPIEIFDQRNYDPDPLPCQLSAIQYLIENQDLILTAVFKELKTVINPWYAEACGEDDWIPELEHNSDLGKHLGILDLKVLPNEKNGMAYYRLDAEYIGDEESGIAIILHKDNVIGHTGIRHMDYACISKDLGLDQNAIFDSHHANRDLGRNMVHQPIPKYAKLKPWQNEATYDYIRMLLSQKKNDEFIDAIEEGNWDINRRFHELGHNCVDLAANGKNPEMIAYLISKGGDYSKSILECIGLNFHNESIECLVKHGANIDQLTYWDTTPLKEEIFNFIEGFGKIAWHEKYNVEMLSDTLRKQEKYKNNILFLLKMGANQNSLDKNGNNYKALLKDRFLDENILRERGIIEKLETILQGGLKT